ncbi:SH2 domain-containing protein 1B-like isoform 1-T1 [Xenentodon cancila]
MESEGTVVRSIYYGRIGSEATERLLERFGCDGNFLLRDSETVQGAYCLCVRKAPFVHTYRLVHTTEGWYLQRNLLMKFGTLESLIEHYRAGRVSHAEIVALTDPLDKRQIPNSFYQEFVYMELSSSSFAE